MINNVSLTGRLTRDPELKYTGSGTAVTNFNLAVNRTFKNANGERETDFIMCQAWRKTAEIIANNLNKGSLIGVEGRIQTRNYQDNDGKTVYITEVVVETVTFLESKAESQNNNYQQNSVPNNQYNQNMGQTTQNQTQNNQFTGQGMDDDPFESSDNVTDISDDDLPFDFAPMR